MTTGFTCAVSGFAGMDAEILRLRNRNREIPETLSYLTWRYQSSPDAPAPCVFWLLDSAGERIGMASAIFRPYWVNGARTLIAVIGDISLDEGWRSQGLGQQLLHFMTQYLDEQFPAHPALVIPTDSARRALGHVGWVAAGTIAPLVYVLDPARHMQAVLRSGALSRALARAIRACARPLIRWQAPRNGTLQISDAPDAALGDFAARVARYGAVERDVGVQSLSWRYVRHPHTQFRFATFARSGDIRGFLVFEDSSTAGTCAVYDLVCDSAQDLRAMLALFTLRSLSNSHLSTLRVLLDERHRWRGELRRLGFIARAPEAVFQVHSRDGSAERWSWRLSQGDKDT